MAGIAVWLGGPQDSPQVEPEPIVHEIRMAANHTVLPLLPVPAMFGPPRQPTAPPAEPMPVADMPAGGKDRTDTPVGNGHPAVPAAPAAAAAGRPSRKNAQPKPSPRKRLYGVHVESDKDRYEAVKGAQPLFQAGLVGEGGSKPYLHTVRVGGERFYRLLVGPYSSRKAARAQAARVERLTGYSDVVPWPESDLAPVEKLPPEPEVPLPLSQPFGPDATQSEPLSGMDAPSGVAAPSGNGALQMASMIEGELIFDVRLGRSIIYRGMICQGRAGRLFLPLSEMFSALRFPIDLDETGASGWFIKENRKFSLSLETGEVVSDMRTMTVPKDHFFSEENEIYVDIDDFNSFFNLRVEPNIPIMELKVIPGEPLPVQSEMDRRSNRRTGTSRDALRYPLRDLDYAAVAPPRLDAKFGVGWRRDKDADTASSTLSGLYRGDILFMSTSLYGTGTYSVTNGEDGEFEFTDASLTAERVMLENKYLKQFSVGDINPTSTPILGGGSLERGVRVSNRNPLATSSFDSRTFTGKGLPGWDVELYRNNTLVAFQTIGENGTYLFENVPLNFGSNRFKLILYGTEGQEEVREEEVMIGADAIPAGSLVYDFSASQQGLGVFGSDNTIVSEVQADDRGAARVKGTVSLGVKDGFILRASGNKDSKNGEDRLDGTLGFSSGFDSYLVKMDYANSSLGTQVATASLRGVAFADHNLNVNAEHQFSDNREDYTTKNDLNVAVSKSVRLEDESNFTYSVNARRLDSMYPAGDSSKYEVGVDLSLFADWGNISNNLSSNFYEKRVGDQEDAVQGALAYYKAFKNDTIRGSTNYNIFSSEPVLSNFSVTGTHRFNRTTSTSVTVSKNFGDYDVASISNQWNFDYSPFTLYLRGSANDDELYVVSAGLSTSIDFDDDMTPSLSPSGVADSGGVSCFVYRDVNYDNVYDVGDEPMEGVVLKSLQSGQIVTTNKDGKALFYRLSPLRPVDIELQEVSLRDPRYYYEKAGEAVLPRKGKVYSLDFPIQVAGDVEGMVYLLADDDARGRPNVPVQILDAEGNVVKGTSTEFDGFFVLPRLTPGTYSLRIDPEFLSRKGYTGTVETGVVMTPEGDLLSDNLLFYGEEQVVAALKDKFAVKMKAEIFDTVHLVEGDLDVVPSRTGSAEGGFAQEQPATQSVALGAPARATEPPETKTPSSAQATAAGRPRAPAQAQPPVQRRYALAIDIFTTEKSAARAVRHYESKYGPELPDCTISYRPDGNTYIVYIEGIEGSKALVHWAGTLLVPDSVRRKSYVMR